MFKKQSPKVLIIGGGFGGVRAALDLIRNTKSPIAIQLVSNQKYLEYYPGMYRVTTGGSSEKVCIPLETIFAAYPSVTIVEDTIVHIDAVLQSAVGSTGVSYGGDYMILAMGSSPNFFNIEGIEEVSYRFKSIHEARRLKERIDTVFRMSSSDTQELLVALHFVIVGGGPSGIELAGELAHYTKQLAHARGIAESLVTIDLIERSDRLLSQLPEQASEAVLRRLQKLGVHVFLNRSLVKAESWTVLLGDMSMGARTVIWTAGTRPSEISQNINGCTYAPSGRIVVNQYLEAQGSKNVFVIGDIADTLYAGLAQTALHHGTYVAKVITSRIVNKVPSIFKPVPNAFNIPVGRGWGIFAFKSIAITGYFPILIRWLIDLHFLASILPFFHALQISLTKNKNKEYLEYDK